MAYHSLAVKAKGRREKSGLSEIVATVRRPIAVAQTDEIPLHLLFADFAIPKRNNIKAIPCRRK